MAKYVLINQVFINGATNLPGSEIDTDVEPLAPFLLAGALLWPAGNATVDAAAAKATADRRNRGINEAAMAEIMKAAVDSVQLQELGSSAWRAVSAWEINPVTGDDANDGQTAATALKTWAKFAERIGIEDYPSIPGALSTAIAPIQLFTVRLRGGNFSATDRIKFRGSLPANSLVAVIGEAKTVASGTMSAANAQSRGTNTPWDMTGAAGIAAYLGGRVRNTTVGANLDQIAWIAKDNGADNVRLSTMNNPGLPEPADKLFQTTTTPGVFSPGDTYVVEELTQVYAEAFDIASSFNGAATVPVIGFANLDFQRDGASQLSSILMPRGDCETVFKGCRFRGTVLTNSTVQRNHFVNCGFDVGANLVRATAFFQGGLSRGEIGVRGSFAFFNGDFMIQGSRLNILIGDVQVWQLAIFDSPSSGITLGVDFGGAAAPGLLAGVGFAPAFLWGAGNAAFGVDLLGATKMRYTALATMTITGTSGDYRLAGDTTFVEQDAAGVYSAPKACTWANITAGNAQNPARGCGIFKSAA